MPADLNDYFNKKRGSGGGDDNGGESKGPKVNFKTPDFKGFGKISAFAYVIIALVAVIALTQPFVTINSAKWASSQIWVNTTRLRCNRDCTFLSRSYKRSS